MTADIWNNKHIQWRQLVCNYSCVSERFAAREWDDVPELARDSITAWFENNPISQLMGHDG